MMRKKSLKSVTGVVAVVFLAAALLAAVIRKPAGEVLEHPHFDEDIVPVFQNNCTLSGCHDAAGTAGLVLLPGEAYADLVDVKSMNEPEYMRVEPGDAENSYLIIKLESRQTAGAQMPRGRAPLSEETIQTIRNWIKQGAEKGH
jgi:hypothetical protein